MSTTQQNPTSKLLGWADDRFGAAKGLRVAMNKVFPDHWSFMLGEIALYSFIILLLSGTYLTLFFVPSMTEVVYNGSYIPLKGVKMTEAASAKAKALFDQEGRDDLALRIAVQPGGCAGLKYQLFFDDRTLDGDLTVDFNGANLVVDRMSAPYVEGASIDFLDTIEQQGFSIDNPNATGSCACGDSFN